jgi:hypothetical protein
MTAVRSAGNGWSASMGLLPSRRGQAIVILPRIGRTGQRRAEIDSVQDGVVACF